MAQGQTGTSGSQSTQGGMQGTSGSQSHSGMQGTSGTQTSGMHGQGGMRGSGGGADNVTYDLISVAYHALQAVETYQRYEQDASRGDQQVQQFFRKVCDDNKRCAQEALQTLQRHLGGQGGQSMQGGSSMGSQSSMHGSTGSQSQSGDSGQYGRGTR